MRKIDSRQMFSSSNTCKIECCESLIFNSKVSDKATLQDSSRVFKLTAHHYKFQLILPRVLIPSVLKLLAPYFSYSFTSLCNIIQVQRLRFIFFIVRKVVTNCYFLSLLALCDNLISVYVHLK